MPKRKKQKRQYVNKREAAAVDQARDIVAMTIRLRADSVDAETRSVEAVIATDEPALVFDMRTYNVIEEILRSEGGSFPETGLVFLNNHYRFSIDDVLGSARDIERHGNEWKARLFFAEGDEIAERAWNKVRQGHIRDVSIGYRYDSDSFVDIGPGQSAVVAGQKYTAGERMLRVVRSWEAHEVSLVPIGADRKAKIREDQAEMPLLEEKETITVNPRLRKYLEKLGLSQAATDGEARSFLVELKGSQRSVACALDYTDGDEGARSSCDVMIRSLGFDPTEPVNLIAGEGSTEAVSVETTPDESAIRQSAITAERERVSGIRSLAGGDIPQEVVDTAISEGITIEAASTRFLQEIRNARSQHTVERDSVSAGPAIHVFGSEDRINRSTLDAVMAVRTGINPVEDAVRFVHGQPMRIDNANDDDLQRAADHAHSMRGAPMIDIVRMACVLDGVQPPMGSASQVMRFVHEQFQLRKLTSGGNFSGIFSTNFSARMLAAYEAASDTTGFFTVEGEVENFKENERTRLEKGGKLTKHARGGEADHTEFSDAMEKYKLNRYSAQHVIDEMDIIDNRIGSLEDHAPEEMGESARLLRPDLVYALIMSNPNMRDGKAIFHADHGNLTTGAGQLDAAAIEAGISGMNTQKEGGKLLSKGRGFALITPEVQSFKADQLVSSSERHQDSGDGNKNTLRSRNVTPISDGRLDTGVVDPDTGADVAGSTADCYMARPGGRHTIEVGYLAGSSRSPDVRTSLLDKGSWGVVHDINMDVAAKFLDWRGFHKIVMA